MKRDRVRGRNDRLLAAQFIDERGPEFACDCCGEKIDKPHGCCWTCVDAGCRIERGGQWWVRSQQCPLMVQARDRFALAERGQPRERYQSPGLLNQDERRESRWADLRGEIEEEFAVLNRAEERTEAAFALVREMKAGRARISFNSSTRPGISAWTTMSEGQRQAIIAKLRARRGAERGGRPMTRGAWPRRGPGRYQAVATLKLCAKCERRPCQDGRSRCDTCLSYQRGLTMKRAARRIDDGRCAQCGDTAEGGPWRCAICNMKRRAKRQGVQVRVVEGR